MSLVQILQHPTVQLTVVSSFVLSVNVNLLKRVFHRNFSLSVFVCLFVCETL